MPIYQPSIPYSEKKKTKKILLLTGDVRVLRVTESLTQTEAASSSTTLGSLNPSHSPVQGFHLHSTSPFSDTACYPREGRVGKTNTTFGPQAPALTQTESAIRTSSQGEQESAAAYVLMWAGNLWTAEVLGWPEEDTEVREIKEFHGRSVHIRSNPR